MRSFLSGVFAMGLLAASAMAFEGGIYSVRAQRRGAEVYKGAVIVEKLTSLWQIRWNTTAGSFSGIGILADSHLYGAWGAPGTYGLMLYSIDSLNGCIGRIAASGREGYAFTGQSERIERVGSALSDDPFVGKFAVTGYDSPADGTSGAIVYTGKLAVTREGAYYRYYWSALGKEGRVQHGVGIRRGPRMAVAWGGAHDGYGVVVYTTAADGKNLLGEVLTNRHTVPVMEELSFLRKVPGANEPLPPEIADPLKRKHPQPWSKAVVGKPFAKGDTVEVVVRDGWVRCDLFRVISVRKDSLQLCSFEPSYPLDGPYAEYNYFWAPISRIRHQPIPSGVSVEPGDLVECYNRFSWHPVKLLFMKNGYWIFYDSVLSDNEKSYALPSEVRHPMKEYFPQWKIGDRISYAVDGVVYPGVVSALDGVFTEVRDDARPDWKRWMVPQQIYPRK